MVCSKIFIVFSCLSKVTIQTLKEQTPPQSPRKCNETLHCAVLTKSPLKPTRFGKKAADQFDIEKQSFTMLRSTTASESVIEKVDVDINIPATAKLPSRKRSLISSLESSVLAIKCFKAVYRCFSCKGEIDCKAAGKGNSGLLITCPTCSTVFLASSSSLSNECMVLLADNHQWYSADFEFLVFAVVMQTCSITLRSRFNRNEYLEFRTLTRSCSAG